MCVYAYIANIFMGKEILKRNPFLSRFRTQCGQIPKYWTTLCTCDPEAAARHSLSKLLIRGLKVDFLPRVAYSQRKVRKRSKKKTFGLILGRCWKDL